MNAGDRHVSGGRAMLLGLIALLSIVAFAFAWRAGLLHEIVARQAVMTPVLTTELLLSKPQQSEVFSLRFTGRYRVTVDLELTNAPQAAAWPSERFSLQGSAEIADTAPGGSTLEKQISMMLDGDEVHATLFEFNTKELKTGEKRLVLRLTPSPGFSRHYAKATLRIQKVPRLAFTF